MNKTLVSHVVVGLVCIVGGAFLSKYVDPSAGALLAGVGGTALGRLIQQPASMRGAVPEKEQP